MKSLNIEHNLNILAAPFVIFLNTNISDVSIFSDSSCVSIENGCFLQDSFCKRYIFLLRLKCIEFYLIDDIVILNERVCIRFFQVFCDLKFFLKNRLLLS